ncbi:MAG: protein-disulfide reductase DsbD family protein [Bradymonadia bacterium]
MLLTLFSTSAQAQPVEPAQQVSASHVTVSLVADGPGVAGGEATLGLRFDLEPEWHVYWYTPGDSGEPPKIKSWQLPEGWQPQGLQWPLPERMQLGPVVNFGYADTVLLPVKVKIPATHAPGPTSVGATVTWLVCKEDCIPGKATLSMSLPVLPEGASDSSVTAPAPTGETPDAVSAAFAAAHDAMPWMGPGGETKGPRGSAKFDLGEGGAVHLSVRAPGLPTAALKRFQFSIYPDQPGWIDLSAPQQFSYDEIDGRLHFTLKRGELMPEDPQRLTGLVVAESEARRKSYALDAARGAVTPAEQPPAPKAPAEPSISLWFAVGLALLGGLLLNLMPCVFPVLSLKIMGFVHQAHGDRRTLRRHGLAFTLGVLLSFWTLAGVLLALKGSGAAVGWGFQLQSPPFVFGLATLLWILALSQSGVFELGLGLTRLGEVSGTGVWGSLLTGALATVVATPCTAPFMGPALGYGLTASTGEAIAVFTALAVGMSAPYLALSWWPAALRKLPKPGPWMETFKQLMAFPLYGTALWLLWVFGAQRGHDPLFKAAGGLLLVSAGLWLWGRLQRGGQHRWWGPLLAAGVTLAGVSAGLNAGRPAPPAPELWSPWSHEAVATTRAEGRPVFVNFTADWCISCKVNESVVFEDADVKAAFAEAGVVALKADWTRKDDVIAAALARHGREGVPLYLYYAPGASTPEVLPQILTPGQILKHVRP